jgi:hypothetical protein
MKTRLFFLLISLSFSTIVYSQIGPGRISGSFSSNIHYYNDDGILNIMAPQDAFASNSYLWLQYHNGPFSAGLQYEAYMPPLQGFPYQLEGNFISHRFLRFKKGIIDITAGSFYEQFGSGLSFRAYEERALGLNNSLDGIRILAKPTSWLSVKGIYGKPRRFNDYANAYIRGIDGEIKLGELFKLENTIQIGGGIISKYQPYTGPDPEFPSTVNAFNTRIEAILGKVSIYSEYVHKTEDPDAMNLFSEEAGNALKVDLSYSTRGFGALLTLRYLNNMNFQAERDLSDGYSNINYLPSNSRQYTYMLSNLYPYSTQANGEFSVQADVNYKIPSGSGLGGKYGTDLRLNYALAGGIDSDSPTSRLFSYMAENKYYGDLNLEITRKWNRKFKTNMAYQQVLYNKGVIEGGTETIRSKIALADIQYRVTRKISVRTEIQHLWTEDDHGNWLAVLAELNLAPAWSVYFSDMTDYQYVEQAHYFNGGISYRSNYFRLNISYGRNREGFICSGGVCRMVPAYKGFNIGISSSF